MKKEVKLVLVNKKTKDLIDGMICRNVDTNEIYSVTDLNHHENMLNNIVEPYLISNEGILLGDDVLIHNDEKTGTIFLEKIVATPNQIGYYIDYIDNDSDCGYNLYTEMTGISNKEINQIINAIPLCTSTKFLPSKGRNKKFFLLLYIYMCVYAINLFCVFFVF